VRLRDLSGTVHTIPFSAISTVSNLTKDFSYYLFNVAVAYREDVDEVMGVLRAIGREMQEDPEFRPLILEPLEILGLDTFADSAVIVKARIKTLPIKQWSVGREFNRRMKRRFDELGIEIPFPHTTLYFGADKKGRAPAAQVVLRPQGAASAEDLLAPANREATSAVQEDAQHRS
jgi:small-conductance mechanosensitive channel